MQYLLQYYNLHSQKEDGTQPLLFRAQYKQINVAKRQKVPIKVCL